MLRTSAEWSTMFPYFIKAFMNFKTGLIAFVKMIHIYFLMDTSASAIKINSFNLLCLWQAIQDFLLKFLVFSTPDVRVVNLILFKTPWLMEPGGSIIQKYLFCDGNPCHRYKNRFFQPSTFVVGNSSLFIKNLGFFNFGLDVRVVNLTLFITNSMAYGTRRFNYIESLMFRTSAEWTTMFLYLIKAFMILKTGLIAFMKMIHIYFVMDTPASAIKMDSFSLLHLWQTIQDYLLKFLAFSTLARISVLI